LKIFLNGPEGPFVYVWFVANDLIASFGPLSAGGFDRLFFGQGHWGKPTVEGARLLEKEAQLRRFKVRLKPITYHPFECKTLRVCLTHLAGNDLPDCARPTPALPAFA